MSTNRLAGQRPSLAQRNKRAILITAIAIVLLSIALAVVNYFVGITQFEDTADGTIYYIKSKDGAYGLYDKEGNRLPLTDDKAHYVTRAGTLVAISEAGNASIYAVLDTEEGEDTSYNSLLVLPYTPRSEIKSIEVHNEHGSYTVYRTGEEDNAFSIKGYEDTMTTINPLRLSAIVVSSGYVVSGYKITADKVDHYGYEEYGLADEIRVDENGNEYRYSPAYYKLTDRDDNVYTVLIGDEIPQGGGYYVRVLGRKAVYVTHETYVSEEYYSGYSYSILCPVEEMVNPAIVYPMTATGYYDVEDFVLCRTDYVADPQGKLEEIVAFTFWPEAERDGTEYQHQIYKMLGEKAGYYASNGISEVLYAFYDMSFLGVRQLGITKEGLAEFNLAQPKYFLSFKYPVENPDTGKKERLQQVLLISEMTERGTYYVASDLFDQIVELDRSALAFLQWPDDQWVDRAYYQMNILHCASLEIESPDYSVIFRLDNTGSQPDKTDKLIITASENGGTPKGIDVDIFKKFYQTLLYASLEGPSDKTEEERAAIEADPARHQLTMTVKTTLGNEFVYSFYYQTGIKSHSVIKGSNDFYVLTNRVNKIISDAGRVVRGEPVDPTANS